jgi:hypothetical protein
MNDIILKNWADLHSQLFEDSWIDEIKRFRSPFAFRGVADTEERLASSIMHMGGDYVTMEKHLIRNFKKYAHTSVSENDNFWNWISLAKHHGLPTRIIDWTFSPYVAMHFMTQEVEYYNSDGVIWAVDFKKIHEKLPKKLKKVLAEEGSDVFTADSISSIVKDFNDFNSLSGDTFMLFFEPPSIDDRIVNQYALFSVLSSADFYPGDWLKEHPKLYKRFIIPAKLKWEIRDKLDQANITERVLFPGLDGLSKWLKRMYTSRS